VLNRCDLLDVTSESYDRCQAVNARGTFFLTQAFARRLISRDRPRDQHHSIVNITSANSVAPSTARGEYCVSMAAASMITKLFAARLAAQGIGVYIMRSLANRLDLCSINTATLGIQAPLHDVIDAVARAGFGGIAPWRRSRRGWHRPSNSQVRPQSDELLPLDVFACIQPPRISWKRGV
jgi:hypothetical protein